MSERDCNRIGFIIYFLVISFFVFILGFGFFKLVDNITESNKARMAKVAIVEFQNKTYKIRKYYKSNASITGIDIETNKEITFYGTFIIHDEN